MTCVLWSPVQFRLVVKYRHCDEEMVVKATDDKMVSCNVLNALGWPSNMLSLVWNDVDSSLPHTMQCA